MALSPLLVIVTTGYQKKEYKKDLTLVSGIYRHIGFCQNKCYALSENILNVLLKTPDKYQALTLKNIFKLSE